MQSNSKVFLHSSGFHVVFEPDEDGWFVVHVPELPGCISQGSDFNDAAMNITSAISDYLSVIQVDGEQLVTDDNERLSSEATVDTRWVTGQVEAA